MNSFLKKTALFLVFASLSYIVFLCIWGLLAPSFLKKNLNSFDVGFSKSRLMEVKHTKNVDLLFLGSSHAYLDFDTRYFSKVNFSSFNLGSTAQTPIQTEILVNRYLDSLNPKTVIFEVHPGVFAADGIESLFDLLDSDNLDKDIFQACLNTKQILVFNSLVYSFFKSEIGLDKNKKIETNYSGYTYIPGGSVERELVFFRNVTYKKMYTHETNPNQYAAFERIVQKLKNKNIRLILIQAPITKALFKSYTINETFDTKMSAVGEYYNFNEIIELNDSLDFFDDAHLNKNGVAKFNTMVIEKVFNK